MSTDLGSIRFRKKPADLSHLGWKDWVGISVLAFLALAETVKLVLQFIYGCLSPCS